MAYQTPSPQINLNTLYPGQGQAVRGKRKYQTLPVEAQLEAEKPAYMNMVGDMTSMMVQDAQFRKNMELMEKQLQMQQDAAQKANWIQGAGLALQAGKLAYDSGLFDSLASVFSSP